MTPSCSRDASERAAGRKAAGPLAGVPKENCVVRARVCRAMLHGLSAKSLQHSVFAISDPCGRLYSPGRPHLCERSALTGHAPAGAHRAEPSRPLVSIALDIANEAALDRLDADESQDVAL